MATLATHIMRNTINSTEWPYNNILVSVRHQLMFTPIAKNAHTSLKRMFVQLSGHPQSITLLHGDIHSNLTSNSTGLRLADYSCLTDFLQDYFGQSVTLEHLGPVQRKKTLFRRKHKDNTLPGKMRSLRTTPFEYELLTPDNVEELSKRFAEDMKRWEHCQ